MQYIITEQAMEQNTWLVFSCFYDTVHSSRCHRWQYHEYDAACFCDTLCCLQYVCNQNRCFIIRFYVRVSLLLWRQYILFFNLKNNANSIAIIRIVIIIYHIWLQIKYVLLDRWCTPTLDSWKKLNQPWK